MISVISRIEKTKQMNKTKQKRFIDSKNKQAAARGEKGVGRKGSEGDQEAQTSSCRINESRV